MSLLLKKLLLLWLLLAGLSCMAAEQTAPATNQVSRSIALRDGDMIEVKVFQEEELSARVRVDPEGQITLPLLGRVNVAGKSIEDAQRHIQILLGQDYLVNPQVILNIVELAKRRFSVIGQVQQPGFFIIPESEKLNLLQAISMAGGYTRLANPSRVVIKRMVNGSITVLKVDAQAMAKEAGAKVIEVQADDMIEVSERLL
jgi:protein involved in polysaccharide export with SLBB domain